MSIFVSIAGYRDPLLGFTIRRALETASSPNALHFGIVDQNTHTLPPLPRRPRHFKYVRLDPIDARGPCFARSIAMGFYDGEDWFLQVDSHMDFDPGWDEILINQARRLAGSARGVALTTYPAGFTLEDGKPVRTPVAGNVLPIVVRNDARFEGDLYRLWFEAQAVSSDEPLPGFHVGAGCLFTHGSFAVDIPYDPQLYFHGEEQSIAARLFTNGWDIWHPVDMPIYHLYKLTGMEAGERAPLHWDPAEEESRRIKWGELERRSQRRLADVLQEKPLGVYGLGRVRTLDDFARFCGIDYRTRTIEARAYASPKIADSEAAA